LPELNCGFIKCSLLFFNRPHIGLILSLIVAVCPKLAFSQAYNFRHLSIEDGLPRSQASAIIFDHHEQAWIGTEGGGLCRYDGSQFLYFTKSDSLLSNRIYSLELIDDEIWIGQKGGVTVFDEDGKFRRNSRIDDESAIVSDICRYKNQVYLATDKGLLVQNGPAFKWYESNPNFAGKNILGFFLPAEDDLWLCTESGLLSFSDPFGKINKARGLGVNQVECAAVFNDQWLIGTYGGGVYVYDRTSGIYVPELLREFGNEEVTSIFVARNKEVWIGTMNNGVYVFSPQNKTVRNFRSENGLANNNVKTILADRWNNIWIGTSGGGISVYQNSPFIKYSRESGLNGNYIYAVVNDGGNNLWVGTEGTGAVRINDSSATLFDEDYGFHSSKVRSIFCDSDGDIWLGTEQNGLGIFSPSIGKDTIFSYFEQKGGGLISDWIECFAEDPRTGEIFIATTYKGIMRVSKGPGFPQEVNFNRYKIKSGQLPERLQHIFMFRGDLWFISPADEFGYIRNGKVTAFREPGVNFRVAAPRGNEVWIGSTDNGILRLVMDGDSVGSKTWITLADSLRSNDIYQLLWEDGNLWVGTERGLDRIGFDSLGTIQRVVHYGAEEGFEGVETNSNAAYRDASGNLWFGTVNGLYQYQGGEINYLQKDDPVILLTDFRIFYESIEKTEYADYYDHGKMIKNLTLPYNQNHIGFSFKAIHYTHAKNIRYRWKLKGIDKDWTPPSTSTEVPYGNLEPGKYSFSVQASIDDQWDGEVITIDFEIDQPYWEKFWFKFSYYAGIAVSIGVGILVIFLRIRRKNTQLRQKLEMEKNLVELEQKALRLQMNPHFIFNVLNSIHNLIILNDPDKARYALAKFSKLMRRVLENSREKAISIDNEIETLENYVQLEKLTSNADVSISFDVDENLDSAEEILPPLMIQPFVENAMIHGLKQLDKKGEIIVGFKLISDHILECTIIDNGRGREHAAKLTAQKENYHKSTALKVTQERLASMNQEVNFVPFEIIDLKDEKGNPAGTKVVIRLLI
jgi:ligand-binding sensor domain-containing protein